MTKKTLIPYDGLIDRRCAEPSIYWINEALPGHWRGPERRLDAHTRQVLTSLLAMVNAGDALGLVFGVLNNKGGLELGMSGELYHNPVLCKWIAHRLDELARDLPNHPDQA